MDEIESIRAFNRFYTRELGLLSRSYLGSGLGVAEVRTLYELAHGTPEGARNCGPGGTVWVARALAARLALDEGYLSRMLKGFERRGWVSRSAEPGDGRRRAITLSAAGREALAPLEEASRQEIAARLDPLPPGQRAALVAGAAAMRRALGDPDLPPQVVTLDDLGPGDPGWVVSRHGTLYARDEGYDPSFEGLVAGIVAGYLQSRDAARERGWIARAGQERLGSIFCMREDDSTARLRLFLIEPQARGQGLGRRMLAACLDFARSAGYRRMVLWTHESHRAACALYAAAGFSMTSSNPAVAFGKGVVDQTWERDL